MRDNKMNIKNIIKEQIKFHLLESLKTQKQKYGEVLVNELKDLDPSNNYKYIEQICKFYKESIDKNEIEKYIKSYNDKLNKNLIPIKYRDINKIKNFDELKDIVDNKSKEKSNREVKKQFYKEQNLDKQFYKKIKNNKGDWLIYTPYNTIQSIILGKDTKWCISQAKINNWFNKYFIDDSVVFYIFINQNNYKEKYQVQIYPNNKKEIYNQEDKRITDKEFEELTGLNLNNFKRYDQFKEINPLIIYDKDGKKIKLLKTLPNGEEIKIYYKDGKKVKQYKIFSDKQEVITYDKNGNKETKATYKNGTLNGKYIEYYENGKIEIECNYKNGNLYGEYKEYYPNGNLQILRNYKDGELDGEYIEYDKNGNKKVLKHYKYGELDGKYIKYYPNENKKVE